MSVIDVNAVTNQKIAVGAVENPACAKLRELAAQVPADQLIVDIGAFRGRTAGWLALGASEGNGAHVVSIDPWETRPLDSWPAGYHDEKVLAQYSEPGVKDLYDQHLAECGVTDLVTPIEGYGAEIAELCEQKVGLLWHDAEHTAEAVEKDLLAWLQHMADGSVIVLHDAGNPNFGVVDGAKTVFQHRQKNWDWSGRDLQLWPKIPDRRGILIVHHKG